MRFFLVILRTCHPSVLSIIITSVNIIDIIPLGLQLWPWAMNEEILRVSTNQSELVGLKFWSEHISCHIYELISQFFRV